MEPKRARVEEQYPEAKLSKALNLLTLSGYTEGLKARVSRNIAAESLTGQAVDATVIAAMEKISKNERSLYSLALGSLTSQSLRNLFLRVLRTTRATPDIRDKLRGAAGIMVLTDDELFNEYISRVQPDAELVSTLIESQAMGYIYNAYNARQPYLERAIKHAAAYNVFFPFTFGTYLNAKGISAADEFLDKIPFDGYFSSDVDIAFMSLNDFTGPKNDLKTAAQNVIAKFSNTYLTDGLVYAISQRNVKMVEVMLELGARPMNTFYSTVFSFNSPTFKYPRNYEDLRNVHNLPVYRALSLRQVRESPEYDAMRALVLAKVEPLYMQAEVKAQLSIEL